jgi:hypothetical protein
MGIMTEERFEEFLRRTLDELDPVPPTPRAEMWASIAQQRRFRSHTRVRVLSRKWASWGVGLAAMLALGIGIGRLTTTREQPSGGSPVASAPVAVNRTAYGLAVSDHMTKAEVLLTSFRSQPDSVLDPEIAIWARDLLSNTRLLLDSPAADDPRTALLLEDLELIIAQIARLSAPSSEENEIIEEGIEKTAVLSRLRATKPAGPAAAGT